MELIAHRRARLLRPRLAGDALERPRLLARLMEGLERPLTLVSAPAGCGKTTLLRQWLDACPARAAWLSLDAHDGDLASFVAGVVGALQTAWPEAGGDVLGLLRLPATPPPDYLGAALTDALLDLPGPTVLVLDDYHVITDPEAHAFVAALLEHPAPDFHLAIAGRVEPPLPLARLRARDQVAELRGRDLAFTPDEARAFLAAADAAGGDLDSAAVAELERRTEGWAAGLRLAALALHEEIDPSRVTRAFAGRRQRHAMDFLLDEVLVRQPAELQAFLLRTSVVERVCGELAEALLDPTPAAGAGAAALRRLVGAELFTTTLEDGTAGDGDRRGWARYHPLFRELLLERLAERDGAEAVAALRRRAADWLAARGLVDEAIEALLAAGDSEAAARLVEGRVELALDREDWPTLWRWLRLLPEETARRRPGLLLAHAFVDQFRGRRASREARQAAAAALLEAGDPPLAPGEEVRLRAQADVIASATFAFRGDGAGTVEAARRALARLPDPEGYLGGVARGMVATGLQQQGRHEEALRSLDAADDAHAGARAPRLLAALALVELQAGALVAAQRWSALLLEASTQRGRPVLVGTAHRFLGRVAYERDALEEARAHFAAAADRGRHNFFTVVEALLGLALTEWAQGRAIGSERLLGELDELLAETGNDEARPLVQACQAHLALQLGDRDESVRWLESQPPDHADILEFMVSPSLTRARALLARGAPGDAAVAATVSAGFRARAEREHATRCLIAALAIEALAERARGDEVTALDRLDRALALAAPSGFARTFLDLGEPLAALLRALAARRPPSPYVAGLLAAFDAAAPPAASPSGRGGGAAANNGQPPAAAALAAASLLTEREAEVLEHICRHLTNKEIAAALSISPMTVKRHVSNVFDKLGVGSRRQAVVQAAALGLLPPAPR